MDFRSKTLYQQKWTAKQETRAYHGEHLTEKRWQCIFNPKLDSVAQLDASLRGSTTDETPFLAQTYAALEKRLDFAVFRAMFASSVRQARQFILHGNVFVNGIKIAHPGYTLKAGDLFHVKPEKVMQALGARKPSLEEGLKVDKTQVVLWNKYVKQAKENPREVWDAKIAKIREMSDSNPKKEQFLEFLKQYNKSLEAQEIEETRSCTPKAMLEKMIKVPLGTGKQVESLAIEDFKYVVERNPKLAKRAFDCFEHFAKSGQLALDKLKLKSPEELSKIVDGLISLSEDMKKNMSNGEKIAIRAGKQHLSELVKLYSADIRKSFESKMGNQAAVEIPYDEKWLSKLTFHDSIDPKVLMEDEAQAKQSVKLPWQTHVYGREDPTKPFFTPWKPRPFLAPFAILPHHLEISFKTCHAVYLRDPVARPGHSEVISPFDLPVHERAYMYYVRRGK